MEVTMAGNVLVTGASRGIGRATAELLASRGFHVHAHYNVAADEAEGLLSDFPDNVTLHRADLSGEAGVNSLLSELAGVPLRGLVNNAGIFEMDGFKEWH